MAKSRITLTIDGEVWRAFKAECIKAQCSASRSVQDFMEQWLRLPRPRLSNDPKNDLLKQAPEIIDALKRSGEFDLAELQEIMDQAFAKAKGAK